MKVFKVSGRSVRMDSKQIGSNIAWYSRYEIVHATLRKEMNEFTLPSLNPSLRKKVEEALSETTDEEDKPSLIVGVQVESAPNPTI